MSASTGKFAGGDTVRFTRTLPGPAERVWDQLTNPALLPVWFGSEGMDFAVGAGEGEPVSLMGGHITGTVVEWLPPSSLAYTWTMHQPGMPPAPESIVRFTLRPIADGIELDLRQSPVPPEIAPFSLSGWHSFLDRLGALLRGEDLGDVMQAMRDNQSLYEHLPAEGKIP